MLSDRKPLSNEVALALFKLETQKIYWAFRRDLVLLMLPMHEEVNQRLSESE